MDGLVVDADVAVVAAVVNDKRTLLAVAVDGIVDGEDLWTALLLMLMLLLSLLLSMIEELDLLALLMMSLTEKTCGRPCC